MRRLIVSNFSCIEKADLEFGRLTVLIGPQASGKSVLSKLAYFFFNLPLDQFRVLQNAGDLDNFRHDLVERFKDWFPVGAWGPKRFQIEFQAGDFQIRLIRTTRNQKLSQGIRIWLSPFFEQQFVANLQAFRAMSGGTPSLDGPAPDFKFWQVQDTSDKRLREHLQSDYVGNQFFVPAGRAFFTSLGRAIVAFEQGRVLDPLTVQFGRLYTGLKDHRMAFRRTQGRPRGRSIDTLQEVLGGKLRKIGDNEFIEASDGRRIPFSALSSGQQELLPLVVVLDYFGEEHVKNALIYIEEPEAHLFPSAQSHLVQELASLVVSSVDNGMVLTTHSPYVLAKINNLIKAGSLAKGANENLSNKIAEIVPRSAWIPEGFVKAFAVQERCLHNIMDSDGLIDAEYLDTVSGDIAREFSSLLGLETIR